MLTFIHKVSQVNNSGQVYRLASTLALRLCRVVNAFVSLQGGSLGEVFATSIAAEGLAARVVHAVAQQALGVSEGLRAHLHNN